MPAPQHRVRDRLSPPRGSRPDTFTDGRARGRLIPSSEACPELVEGPVLSLLRLRSATLSMNGKAAVRPEPVLSLS